MGRRERFVWQAAIAALIAHVVVLAALVHWGGLPAPRGTAYASVDFVDFAVPERTRTMEEAVRERMEQRMEQVRNVAADARAGGTDELRSSVAQDDRIAQDVEAELRAFEQSAFDALADGREPDRNADIDKGDAGPSEVDNRYEGWDARYAGQVTAEFSLEAARAYRSTFRDTVAGEAAWSSWPFRYRRVAKSSRPRSNRRRQPMAPPWRSA